jgi:hypothetical protein
MALEAPGKLTIVEITATPCRHGLPLHPIVGDGGFARWEGPGDGALWISERRC